jgi:hypothetical protein
MDVVDIIVNSPTTTKQGMRTFRPCDHQVGQSHRLSCTGRFERRWPDATPLTPIKESPASGGYLMLYRRFEQLIDIFRDAPTAAPPNRVLPYTYYLKQVWPSFAALLVVGLFAALIEVALFSYLSRIIDLAQGTPEFLQRPQP